MTRSGARVRRWTRREGSREAGAVAIVVVLFAVVLFGIAALVVDIGNAQSVRSRAQAAADAGALAGAQELARYVQHGGPPPDPNLVTTVEDTVAANLGPGWRPDWASCTAPAPYAFSQASACIFYRLVGSGSAASYVVHVQMPTRRVEAAFAGLFGVGSISVSPLAEATVGGSAPCEPCDPALDETGRPQGTPSPIAVLSPARIGMLGGGGCPQPGYYDHEDVVAAPTGVDQTCRLTAGLYYFDGGSLTVPSATTLTTWPGQGVTLVFDGATLEVAGSLDLYATPGDAAPAQDELPGVALIFTGSVSGNFELGKDFFVSGSLYALPGAADWGTDLGDCTATGTCELDDGVLAVASTDFEGSVPYVKSNLTGAHLSE